MDSNKRKALLALALALSNEKKKKKRIWCQEWYKLRSRFTHEHLQRVLQATAPNDYKHFLRMDDRTYETLLGMVEPLIKKTDTNMRQAISVNQRLSVTLRFLASGIDLQELKYTCAIHPRTLELIIMETCEAIITILKNHIQIPRNSENWRQIADQFENQWNFPHCIGSVDGKHVEIEKPANCGSYYYNYKGTHSIVLMAIVNADNEFMMIDVGANGRISDGGVLKNTEFWRQFSNNQLNIPEPMELSSTSNKKIPFVFIGDEAFQLTPNFMKPYNKAILTDERRIFNYRLSRARRVVENAFGILSSRFKIFKKAIPMPPEKVRKMVMACCYLHNYLSKHKRYIQRSDVDVEDTLSGTIRPGLWRQEDRQLCKVLEVIRPETQSKSEMIFVNILIRMAQCHGKINVYPNKIGLLTIK